MKVNVFMKVIVLVFIIACSVSVSSGASPSVEITSPQEGQTYVCPVPEIGITGQTIPVVWNAPSHMSNIYVALLEGSIYGYQYGSDVRTYFFATNPGNATIVLGGEFNSTATGLFVVRVSGVVDGVGVTSDTGEFSIHTLRAGITMVSPTEIGAVVIRDEPYQIEWSITNGLVAVDSMLIKIGKVGSPEITYRDIPNIPVTTNKVTINPLADGYTEGQWQFTMWGYDSSRRVCAVKNFWFHFVSDENQTPVIKILDFGSHVGLEHISQPYPRRYWIESSTDMKKWSRVGSYPVTFGETLLFPKSGQATFFRSVLSK